MARYFTYQVCWFLANRQENVQQSFATATATVQQGNSYWHLAHQQSESRSLILMDPPYDPYETYMAWNLFLLQHFYEKWPQSCVLLWFPYLDDDQVAGLYQRLRLLQLDDVLVAEFGVQETESLETSGRVAVGSWGMLGTWRENSQNKGDIFEMGPKHLWVAMGGNES